MFPGMPPMPDLRSLQHARHWAKLERELASKTQEQRLESVRRLPITKIRGLNTPEIWAVSFTELIGDIHMVTICIEHIGSPCDRMIIQGKLHMCKGAPSTTFVIAALCSAMTHPTTAQMTGPPHRPVHLFIAYRLRGSYDEICAAMGSCGISCELESISAAKESAAMHGVDYLGRNVSKKCAAGGFKVDLDALSRCALSLFWTAAAVATAAIMFLCAMLRKLIGR